MNSESDIWQLRGQFPVLWTLPIYVKIFGKPEEAEIAAAVPLLRCQELAFDQLLKPIARKVNGLWILPKSSLKKVAMTTDGGDPEQYFSWESRRIARERHPVAQARKNMQEFLDEIYQMGIGRSRDEVEYIWRSFCNHMLDWLINKERPVDLYFLRLHPSVYRRNWLARLQRDLPWTYRSRRGIRKNKELRGFLSWGSLLEVSKKGYCQRSIDVELDASWFKIIRNVETVRLARLNPCGYAQLISNSIGDRAEISLKLFSDYIASYFSPHGSVRKGELAGTFSIRPTLRTNNMPHKSSSLRKRSHARRRLARKWQAAHIKKTLSRQNGTVPEVSHFQSKTEDVRES